MLFNCAFKPASPAFWSAQACLRLHRSRACPASCLPASRQITRRRQACALQNVIVLKILFLLLFILFSTLSAEEPWGKDAELAYWKPQNTCHRPSNGPLGRAGEMLVTFHQAVLSDSDGPRSHFEPTSSEYTRQAMVKYGFFKGVMYGCDRLMRENNDPWIYPKATGRYDMSVKLDPVP